MSKKEPARRVGGRMTSTRRGSTERLHRRFSEMHATATPQRTASPRRGLAAAAAAGATAAVTFSSSNANHLIQITAGLHSAAAKGSVSIGLSSGRRTVVGWQIQGNGAFSLTANGGTLDGPVSSTAPDAGVVGVTVP